MTLREFMKYQPKTNIAVSVLINLPTGQYDPGKIVNIGTNRWAFKPEVGLSRTFGNWQMDAYAGVWLFAANEDHVNGTLTQDPLSSLEFHMTYNVRPGLWAGLDTNFYWGGRTTIGSTPSPVEFDNSRIGGTISVPVARSQSIKFSVSTGTLATSGGNFTSFGMAYNLVWGGTK